MSDKITVESFKKTLWDSYNGWGIVVDKAAPDCFELAKKFAIGFYSWHIQQLRDGTQTVFGKTPEQLLELYLKDQQ